MRVFRGRLAFSRCIDPDGPAGGGARSGGGGGGGAGVCGVGLGRQAFDSLEEAVSSGSLNFSIVELLNDCRWKHG